MEMKAFKLLPCIFCTIGYNCYVAGHNITAKGYQSWNNLQIKSTDSDAIEKSKNKN
jgi:hypothetical protein